MSHAQKFAHVIKTSMLVNQNNHDKFVYGGDKNALTRCYCIAVVPNVIRNATVSKATQLLQTTGCIVTVHWMTPNNSNETIVNHYIVDYPLGSFSTKDGSTNKARLVMDDCEAVNFTIYAVDICNREGAKMRSYKDVTDWMTTETSHSAVTSASFPAVTCGQLSTGVL